MCLTTIRIETPMRKKPRFSNSASFHLWPLSLLPYEKAISWREAPDTRTPSHSPRRKMRKVQITFTLSGMDTGSVGADKRAYSAVLHLVPSLRNASNYTNHIGRM